MRTVNYSTRNELKFIETIGSRLDEEKRPSRAELLRGYLASCERRNDWSDIDSGAVIDFAKSELEKCDDSR